MATVQVSDVVPSPEQDCERLNKAFRGWGTDEKAVIKVLGKRNASQRRNISETYQQLYNQSLFDSLRSELSGDFLKAAVLWTYDPAERDARLINEALNGKHKGVQNLQVVVEVACASSPHHVMAVRQAYCSLFDCSIEEDISANVQLPSRKLLLGLISSYRYDKEVVDMNIAKSEAAHLHEFIQNEQLVYNHVLWILATRNFFQLRSTFECYKQEFSSSFDQDILNSSTGEFYTLLRIAILCIESPEKHFAEVIRTSVHRLGTKEKALTRAIVTRAEVDMVKIKEEYLRMYKSSVEDAVIGDTSGDYKHFLLTLLGKET